MQKFKHSLENLAKHSKLVETCQNAGMKSKIFCLDDPTSREKIVNFDFDPYITFHPTGCGMIELEDDYLFDIRCNHCIFIEGYCEGDETDWECESVWWTDDFEVCQNENSWRNAFPAVLIQGNHKGAFRQFIICFTREN